MHNDFNLHAFSRKGHSSMFLEVVKGLCVGVSKASVWVFKALRQKITSNSEVTAYYETFVLEDKLSSVVLDDLKAYEQVRIVLNRKRSKPVLFVLWRISVCISLVYHCNSMFISL